MGMIKPDDIHRQATSGFQYLDEFSFVNQVAVVSAFLGDVLGTVRFRYHALLSLIASDKDAAALLGIGLARVVEYIIKYLS